MIIAPKQWSPLVCIILASIILSAGCKTTSWTSLPGMSYFAKDEAPAASYYGSNGQPTNDYTSQAPATTDQSPADPGTVHRQYNSTNQGTSDYLGNPPYTGPQYNSAATEQPIYDGQRQQYQSYQAPQQQPQQYQPYQQYPAQQQQPQAPEYQPYQPQQPITNPPAPGAASLQQNPNQYIQGFYDPNAAPATPTTSATATPPATAPQGNDAYILSPNAGTNTTGAAAYTAELPNQSPQFDGIYNPEAPTPPVQPTAAPYRPGSTGDANSYYAPVAPATPSTNGGAYNGR